jgi:chromosome segregation ATPase
MGDKRRRSITIDRDIDEQLQSKDNLNASATVNQLLREYLAAGKAPEAALTMRLNEVEAELQQQREQKARLESKIERLERKKDDLAAKIRQREHDQQEHVEHMAGKIRRGEFDRADLTTENAAVQTQADNANLAVAQFIDRVEAALDDA